MAQKSYKIIERRQKAYVKAYAIMVIALVLTMGFYSYTKWEEYSTLRKGVEQNQVFAEVLRGKVSDEKAIYDANRDSFAEINKEIEQRLANIFPVADNYTALTRQIDTFEEELNKKSDRFEISNLEFRQPIDGENASILPLRMSITSSASNFTKFLHMIENSGSLNDQIRLMDISSIRLSFSDSDEISAKEQTINFSLQINAYFQKST